MQALSYHQRTADFFKSKTQLWHYFSMALPEDDTNQVKTEVLKATYRLEPATEPHLYAAVARVQEVLQIPQKVTLYQLMDSDARNAQVYTQPDEVHIIFSGPVLKALDEKEVLAVLSHELGHALLYKQEDYNTSNKILNALSDHISARNEYLETARLFDLYTELFCDSQCLKVTGDIHAAISALVKMGTGLEQVAAESYIRQAIEIFGQGKVHTQNDSHPEMFIRAYALHLQVSQPDTWQELIRPVIEGTMHLNRLDIFAQQQLAAYTRHCLDWLLSPPGLQSAELLHLFNEYFPSEKISAATLPDSPADDYDNSSRDYLAYVLLDFALVDPETEEQVLERAFMLAKATGLIDNLEAAIKKELKLSHKKYNERFKKLIAV